MKISVFFLHLFQKRTFGDEWHRLCYGSDVLLVTQPTLKEPQHTDPNWRSETHPFSSATALLKEETLLSVLYSHQTETVPDY